MSALVAYGWTAEIQHVWDEFSSPGTVPARVIADFGTSLKIATPVVMIAELSGKLAHYTDKTKTPKVGDWVAVRFSDNYTIIESIIPRVNEIARKVSGKRTMKQVIAANVDVAFVLLALDNDFSVERLKRFLYQLSISSVKPIIVLNKADKASDLQSYTSQLQHLSIPIIVTTAIDGIGVDKVASCISSGSTAILLGSSGTGKSTLINKLIGKDTQKTGRVKVSDTTGRHTTVHRELFILPNGGILIDTPGIRELQLWGTGDELDVAYNDIVSLASSCRYANCRHGSEAGCAINEALAGTTLNQGHYRNYVKMKSELTALKSMNIKKTRLNNRYRFHDTKRRRRIVFDADDECG
jgi:ribosome biogenesis GTPase